jgi:hypothetical protein
MFRVKMFLVVVASVFLFLPVAACQPAAVPVTAPAPGAPEKVAPASAPAEIKPKTVPADTQPEPVARHTISEDAQSEETIPPGAPSGAPAETTAPPPVPDDTASAEPELSDELRRNSEMMTSGGKRGFNESGLGIGEMAVNFTLRDIDSREFRLSGLLAEKPVVMVFGSFT